MLKMPKQLAMKTLGRYGLPGLALRDPVKVLLGFRE